jgi:hypothetical protein
VALGNDFLTISPILHTIFKVTSLTLFLFPTGIFKSILMTVSALVALTIATSAPFFPFAALLVTIVYSSPLVNAVSSIDKYSPIFSKKSNHWLARDFCSQELNSLR